MLQTLLLVAVRQPWSCRQIASSCVCLAGKTWRERQGLGRSGNEYGPLTDLPDWSYADGRPAPPQPNQLRRKEEQRLLAERIDLLAQEMLQAKVTHREKKEAELQAKERRAERRLKPKGSFWRKEGYIDKRQPASS